MNGDFLPENILCKHTWALIVRWNDLLLESSLDAREVDTGCQLNSDIWKNFIEPILKLLIPNGFTIWKMWVITFKNYCSI